MTQVWVVMRYGGGNWPDDDDELVAVFTSRKRADAVAPRWSESSGVHHGVHGPFLLDEDDA